MLDMNFSRDNNLAATLGGDDSIRLWDVKTGKEIRTLSGFNFDEKIWETYYEFSPNGWHYASPSYALLCAYMRCHNSLCPSQIL